MVFLILGFPEQILEPSLDVSRLLPSDYGGVCRGLNGKGVRIAGDYIDG